MSVIAAVRMQSFPPLDHFDYSTVDESCCCAICVEWRNKLTTLTGAGDHISAHPRACACVECKSYMRLRSSYLASLNRRDLYCESSWHASEMSPRELGEQFMEWLTKILADRSAYSDGWWEGRAPYFPLIFWQTLFRRSVSKRIAHELAALESLMVDMPKATLANCVLAASGISAQISASGVC